MPALAPQTAPQRPRPATPPFPGADEPDRSLAVGAERLFAANLFAENRALIGLVLSRHFPSLRADPDARGDAEAAALAGLWKACTRYDPGAGAFSTFAVQCIRGAVLTHLRTERRQTRRLETVSLDGPQGDDDGDGDEWHERIADEGAEVPGAALVSQSSFEALLSTAGLSDRHRDVLRAVYRDGEALSAVAAQWGVSKSRAGQLEQRALAVLRAALGVTANDGARRVLGDC